MSISSSSVVRDDGSMSNNNPDPRPDGPKTRRAFTAEQKVGYLAAYEQATETSEGNDYLRSQGLYASQVAEWRRLRDAGLLNSSPGAPTGTRGGTRGATRMSAEQAEIARLRRQLDVSVRKLARTEVALEIMGKARELLEELSESSPEPPPHDKR